MGLNFREIDAQFHIGVYGHPRFFDKMFLTGKGARLYDQSGKEYIDCLGGLAFISVGYDHPRFVNALAKISTSGRPTHDSNLSYIKEQVEYVEKLAKHLPLESPKIFFCNSGGEATGGAIKAAYKAGDGRKKIVSMKNSFHGRLGWALAVTGQEKYTKPFQDLLYPNVEFVPFNSKEGLERIDNDTFAVIVEPVQGEGGIIPAELEFMKNLRTYCDSAGALLIFDEVQTGFGRTGKMFAAEHYVQPDIISLSKGIANGLPMGAFAVNAKADKLEKGDHAVTLGGGPFVCAGASAVLDILLEEGIPEHVSKMERVFYDVNFKELERAKDQRGKGLMLGIEFDTADTRNAIVKECEENGILFGGAGTSVLRIEPPLPIPKNDFERAMEILYRNIKHYEPAK